MEQETTSFDATVVAQCWRDEILERIAVELHETAKRLNHFQHELSIILARAHVSARSMQQLQALDETTQILEDLSRVVQVVARHGDASPNDGMSSILNAVNLGGLRSRLHGETAPFHPETSKLKGDVSLF